MANSVDPDQMPHSAHLIWVYTVCKGLSVPILWVITISVFKAYTDNEGPVQPEHLLKSGPLKSPYRINGN